MDYIKLEPQSVRDRNYEKPVKKSFTLFQILFFHNTHWI